MATLNSSMSISPLPSVSHILKYLRAFASLIRTSRKGSLVKQQQDQNGINLGCFNFIIFDCFFIYIFRNSSKEIKPELSSSNKIKMSIALNVLMNAFIPSLSNKSFSLIFSFSVATDSSLNTFNLGLAAIASILLFL